MVQEVRDLSPLLADRGSRRPPSNSTPVNRRRRSQYKAKTAPLKASEGSPSAHLLDEGRDRFHSFINKRFPFVDLCEMCPIPDNDKSMDDRIWTQYVHFLRVIDAF